MTDIIIKTRKQLIEFLEARSVEDSEIKWTCPKCGTKNIGAYHSHETRCGGDNCNFKFPRLNLKKVLESDAEATQIANEIKSYRERIERQWEVVEELESELDDEKRRLEDLKKELADLKTCDMEKVKAEW